MSSGRTEYPDPEVIAACCPNKENLLHEKYIFLFHNSLQSIKIDVLPILNTRYKGCM